jgi:hypothetical protein
MIVNARHRLNQMMQNAISKEYFPGLLSNGKEDIDYLEENTTINLRYTL